MLAAALAVQPRIADVRDGNPVVVEQGGDDGRAHAFALGLRARGLVDDLVGARDGVAQHDATDASDRCPRSSEPRSSRSRPSRDQVGDGLDGDAAGDFAGVVAAHAIGQHEQADVGIDADGVLVVLADAAGVGQPDRADLAAH